VKIYQPVCVTLLANFITRILFLFRVIFSMMSQLDVRREEYRLYVCSTLSSSDILHITLYIRINSQVT